MNKIVLIIIALIVCSCNLINSKFEGEKVAQTKGAILYKTDLERIIPKGVSSADSAKIANEYINSWAVKQLLLQKANENLPTEDKDIEALLNDYKTQLLIYRFEKRYVEERLDTLVQEEEMEQFYNKYPDNFIGEYGVIKGRIIKVYNSSPNLQIFRKLTKSKDAEDFMEVEEIAKSSALKYNDFNENWVGLDVVASEVGVPYDELVEKLEKKNDQSLEFKDSLYTHWLQVVEYVKEGEVTPFEFNRNKIKEIIISKRKQTLLNNLHSDILKEAISNKNFNILKNDKEIE